MLTVEHPLIFVLRGKIPSLKNNRIIKQSSKTGKMQSIPQGEVVKAIRNIKTALDRQMPSALRAQGYPLVAVPEQIFLIVHLGVVYASDLPTSDVDNAVTTVQEAMAGVIYENDKQVMGTSQKRIQFQTDLALHTKVYIWTGSVNTFESDVVTILKNNKLIR